MKFCKDCVHIQIGDSGINYARCALTKKMSPPDLVTGEPAIEFAYCSIERGYKIDTAHCGPDARFFEQYVQLCEACEDRPAMKDEELCLECAANAEESAYERSQEGECFRGSEATGFFSESQARIQRDLK
jgi:hypothetical protein